MYLHVFNLNINLLRIKVQVKIFYLWKLGEPKREKENKVVLCVEIFRQEKPSSFI